MNRKTKILLVTVGLFSLLTTNLTFSGAVSPGWSVGDLLLWGSLSRNYSIINGITSDNSVVNEYKYNITAIDLLNLQYDTEVISSGGTSFFHNVNFGADYFVTTVLTIPNMLTIDYSWDYVHNRTVLTTFDFYIWAINLIEPDWSAINNGFRDTLNGSEIIHTEHDPYNPTIYNYTLQSVFDSLKGKINGKKPFSAGWNTFTVSRTKWTFFFDMSGVLYYGESNGSMIIYYPYEKATISFELEYTDAGVLKESNYIVEQKLVTPTETLELTYQVRTTLGGFKSVQANFATLVVFGALTFLSAIVVIRQRTKR
ncbi:MAG: hypothetical protein K9W42_14180 [Candidatus Heimdallarchaeota archaeon]|nr:hypothetical protein [Candidatus Heimdallarchaeota archaeon]